MPNGIPYQNALENRAIVAGSAKASRFSPHLNPEIRAFAISDKAPKYYIYTNGIQYMSCIHFNKVKRKDAVDDDDTMWIRHRCIYAQGDKWTYAVRFYYCQRTRQWSDSRHKDKSNAIRTDCQGYTTQQLMSILHKWTSNMVMVEHMIDACFED